MDAAMLADPSTGPPEIRSATKWAFAWSWAGAPFMMLRQTTAFSTQADDNVLTSAGRLHKVLPCSVNIALLAAKVVAFSLSGSKAVLASLADSAGRF